MSYIPAMLNRFTVPAVTGHPDRFTIPMAASWGIPGSRCKCVLTTCLQLRHQLATPYLHRRPLPIQRSEWTSAGFYAARASAIATTIAPCPRWVKSRKVQTEQMFSGLCLKARRNAFMSTRRGSTLVHGIDVRLDVRDAENLLLNTRRSRVSRTRKQVVP